MSWRQALFIAVAGKKHRVAATSVSRPLLTALLLGSIGCSSYCCYAFVINPLQKLTLDSRKILQNESDNHDRCLHPLYCPDRKQHATNIGSLLLSSTRTYSTKADKYFQKHHRIPLPEISHDNLDRLLQLHQHPEQKEANNDNAPQSSSASDSNILIIGDVHGCLVELKLLIQKAIHQHNQSQNFRAIVLVGDLVNKGPQSAEVIKFVRRQQQKYHNVFTVRGNHDDRALAAALGDEECARKSRYDWVKKGLSDEDIEWMAELPYTITIPSRLLKQPQGSGSETKQDQDVIVVHAGLLPNVSLVDQDTRTMTTIRDLISIPDEVDGKETKENIAKAWKGPELVIFGHDAKRGLQQEEYAIGLDTGCVYGKQLTGIILPEKKIVNVDASEVYSPINAKD
ncbi:metallophosphoesterase [Skeletonema marinoi]|uniref:Metallophosphoesterase n=1 Tax=Skeletonema marinoi TaxID=267567 RepID=A0AAD8XSL4_9STRA|nr:metallophosphoesterase [Skeletonema marinoi]